MSNPMEIKEDNKDSYQGGPAINYTMNPPKFKGHYQIGGPIGFGFYFKDKPNFLKRFCMKYFLGFDWLDEIPN